MNLLEQLEHYSNRLDKMKMASSELFVLTQDEFVFKCRAIKRAKIVFPEVEEDHQGIIKGNHISCSEIFIEDVSIDNVRIVGRFKDTIWIQTSKLMRPVRAWEYLFEQAGVFYPNRTHFEIPEDSKNRNAMLRVIEMFLKNVISVYQNRLFQ